MQIHMNFSTVHYQNCFKSYTWTCISLKFWLKIILILWSCGLNIGHEPQSSHLSIPVFAIRSKSSAAPVEKPSSTNKEEEEEDKAKSRDWEQDSEKSERKVRERHASSVSGATPPTLLPSSSGRNPLPLSQWNLIYPSAAVYQNIQCW